MPAYLSPSLFNGPNSARSAAWRGLLTRVLLGPPCAWGLAQRAASCETRRESGCSHIGFALGCDEEVYLEKSISTQVRNIDGTSLSSVAYAYCTFINIFKKEPLSLEKSSVVSGGLTSIVFVELGIQSSHLSRTTQQKIWYHVKKSFPGNVASSLAKAS